MKCRGKSVKDILKARERGRRRGGGEGERGGGGGGEEKEEDEKKKSFLTTSALSLLFAFGGSRDVWSCSSQLATMRGQT